MTTPDPVDLRLLTLLAQSGRAAVHELAGQLGMDPREAAGRLVALSATGLPLIVGAECDQNQLRGILAQLQQPQPPNPYAPPGYQPHPGVHGTPSGTYPVPGAPYPAQGTPSGPYPGPFPPQGTPSGALPTQGAQGAPNPYPPQAGPANPYAPPPANPVHATPTGQYPPPGPPSGGAPQQPDPVSTWGVPQSSSWARGDQPEAAQPPAAPKAGQIGETLNTTGLEGEPISIHLVEVVDPADFLFTAAGYTLGAHERSVVVHTEVTNHGQRPYNTLPDLYLMLYTAEGHSIGKAPISLSSRPPHGIGVPPGETVGGHAVYVIGQHTRIIEIRWLARPDSTENALTWEV